MGASVARVIVIFGEVKLSLVLRHHCKPCLYSVFLTRGSDVSTQAQHVHTLFVCACARMPVCTISLGAHNSALRIVNKRAASMPGERETEYI